MKKRNIIILLTSILIFTTSLPYAQNLGLHIEGTGSGAGQRITDTLSGNSLVLQSGSGVNLKVTGYNYETFTGQPLYLSVDGANTILNPYGGSVGIGTTVPMEKLHVGGSIKADGPRISFAGKYFEEGGEFEINCHGDLVTTEDGVFNLGSNAKKWGSVWAYNGTINTSDARNKKDIEDLAYGLKELLELHPVSFSWKDRPEEGTKLGLIAQEARQIIPEVIVEYEYRRNENGRSLEKIKVDRLGIYYSDLIPVLIKSIQEQQLMIQNLTNLINQLQEEVVENQTLNERITNLEKIFEQKN